MQPIDQRPESAPNPQASEGAEGAQPDSPPEDVAALQREVAALQVQLEAQATDLGGRSAELANQNSELQEQLSVLNTQHSALRAEHLAAVRRALLAENAGQLVPELVRGDTQEELESSVALAREAYDRILKAAQAELAEARAQVAAQVPAGASATAPPPADNLSPLQKISQALSRNNR